MLQKLSKASYWTGRKSRDINAVSQAFKKKSASPILKRIANKLIGRYIVSRLFFK